MNPLVTGYRCDRCGTLHPSDSLLYLCPEHGWEGGTLSVEYDYQAVGARLTRESLAADRTPSQWRYQDLLPPHPESPKPGVRVGMTPLYSSAALSSALGIDALYVKDDGLNPSASTKDRASTVCVARAMEEGLDVITAASTGNAASSVALLARAAGIRAVLFVPAAAPAAKIAQLLMFGAEVVAVEGSYDQAYDLCLGAVERWGWFSRNTAHNPVLREGKKTLALEILEQLDWEVPDWVAISVGDGCIFSGLYKGFLDAKRIGLVDRVPKLLGVQAEGASPLAKAFAAGATFPERDDQAATRADSICVGAPRDGYRALQAVRESGGQLIAVSDEAIFEAMRALAGGAAVLAEPSGAAAYAGYAELAARGELKPGDRCVTIVSGNGLKDVAAVREAAAAEPHIVPPDLDRIAAELKLP